MVILKAASYEEAQAISESDPFIAEGYKEFQLWTMHVANRENAFLLG